MRKVALRGLLAHKARLAMTLSAVALGVAFISGVLVFTDTMQKSFDEMFETVYDGTDAVVRSESTIDSDFGMPDERGTLDEAVLADVREVESVEAAAGEIEGFAQVIDAEGEPLSGGAFGGPSILASVDISQKDHWDEVSTIDLRSGRWPEADDEMMVDVATEESSDYSVGDTVPLQTEGGLNEYTLVGTVGFGDKDSAAGQSLVALTTTEAQRVAGEPGRVDTITVKATSGTSQEQVAEDIRSVMASGVEVITGDEAVTEAQDDLAEGLGFLTIFFLVFALVATVVGAFVIYNSFAIIVAQRTREMALLRAIGATRRQVRRAVFVEAVVTGVVGSVLGFVVGLGLAVVFGSFLDVDGDLAILPTSVAVAVIVGVVVTVASALVPAWRASRVPPVAAMRDVAVDATGRSLVRLLLGAVLLGLGAFLGATGAVAHEVSNVGLGVGLAFVGVLFVAPGLARPVSRALGWPLARTRGITGSLAKNNAARNPRRTASTGLALTIGVGIVVFFLILNASLRSSFDKIVDDNFTGDFVLQASGQGFLGLPQELAPEVDAIDDVERVTSLRFTNLTVDGEREFALGASPTMFESFGFGTEGSTDLEAGELVMLADAAESAGVGLGDQVELEFLDTEEPVSLTVTGFYEDRPGLEMGDYVLGLDDLSEYVPSVGDGMVVIDLAPDASADAARAEIADVVEDLAPAAEVQDNEDLKDSVAADLDTMLQIILGLLLLAIVIAFLGIANTVALSVMERTRELGLLRAVGMSRAQLRSAIRWESVIIALFGATLGLAVGGLGGWGLVTSLADEGFEVFTLPVVQLVIVAVAAGVFGVGAALYPAWRAGRLDVLTAIHTE
jgi:putative ABC transport system permease protein